MRLIRSLVTLPLLAATLHAQQAPTHPDLRAELVRLGTDDQAARDGFGEAAAANDTAFMQRLMAGDSLRTRRLREIVAGHGWPGQVMVGDDGARAAWLILQHSDDAAFQEVTLPLLWQAAEHGDVDRPDVAMLTDRVLVRQGKSQRYGSSFSMDDGRLVPDPIDDLAGLDERRAGVGLPPMAEYVRAMAEMYRIPVEWPPRP